MTAMLCGRNAVQVKGTGDPAQARTLYARYVRSWALVQEHRFQLF